MNFGHAPKHEQCRHAHRCQHSIRTNPFRQGSDGRFRTHGTPHGLRRSGIPNARGSSGDSLPIARRSGRLAPPSGGPTIGSAELRRFRSPPSLRLLATLRKSSSATVRLCPRVLRPSSDRTIVGRMPHLGLLARFGISEPDAGSFDPSHMPGSYRLRRHFPRHCDVSTRVRHPYRLRFLRRQTAAARRHAPIRHRGLFTLGCRNLFPKIRRGPYARLSERSVPRSAPSVHNRFQRMPERTSAESTTSLPS